MAQHSVPHWQEYFGGGGDSDEETRGGQDRSFLLGPACGGCVCGSRTVHRTGGRLENSSCEQLSSHQIRPLPHTQHIPPPAERPTTPRRKCSSQHTWEEWSLEYRNSSLPTTTARTTHRALQQQHRSPSPQLFSWQDGAPQEHGGS